MNENIKKDYTIIIPMYGHSEFCDLAVKSIAKHSVLSPRLILAVEPVNNKEDEAWLNSLDTIWPYEYEIIRNEKTLGYYSSVNNAVSHCKTDIAVLYTSDQVAAPNWDIMLLEHLKPNRFVTGRLIESGATLIADQNIWKNFGYTPEEFRMKDFIEFCTKYKTKKVLDTPRHYIPMAFYVDDFKRAGMFVDVVDNGTNNTDREDFYFFLRSVKAGFEIVEVQKPLSYHFQSASRVGRFKTSLLNYVYPFGLKYLHRLVTGYVSLYDAMRKLEREMEKIVITFETYETSEIIIQESTYVIIITLGLIFLFGVGCGIGGLLLMQSML